MRSVFKVLFIGEGGVGKTSILRRHTTGWFEAGTKLTVGVDFAVKQVSHDGWKATLQIWDIGGQMRFRDITNAYFRGARGAIAVFDVTRPYTLENLTNWIARLHEVESDVVMVVVGNKTDQREDSDLPQPPVTPEQGKTYAEKYNAPYVEASAKDGNGVNKIFDEVTRLLSERYPD
ncbi:MAG: Rab family GTPase [Promethearchaeota archaeon]